MSEEEESKTSGRADDASNVVETDYSGNATCIGCGYRLRSLPEPRCPECGRAFDPRNPDTMNVPVWKPSPLRLLTFGQEMVRSSMVAMALVIVGRLKLNHIASLYGILMWVVIVLVWAIRSITGGRYPSSPEGPRWRIKVALLLVLTLLLPVRTYDCPHATTVWFGAFGISHSDGNGPCHNSPHCGGVRIIGTWFYAYSRWF